MQGCNSEINVEGSRTPNLEQQTNFYYVLHSSV